MLETALTPAVRAACAVSLLTGIEVTTRDAEGSIANRLRPLSQSSWLDHVGSVVYPKFSKYSMKALRAVSEESLRGKAEESTITKLDSPRASARAAGFST